MACLINIKENILRVLVGSGLFYVVSVYSLIRNKGSFLWIFPCKLGKKLNDM